MFFAGRYEASGLGYLIIGLMHPVRSLFGFYIYKYLPSIPTVIDEICPEVNSQLKYKDAVQKLP